MRKFPGVMPCMLLLATTLVAQQRTDWINTSNNADIQYRVQVFDQSKACDLEYRDQKQGAGYTTFDVDVDYKSTKLDSANQAPTKTDGEHIVTAPGHTGASRISECSAIVAVRVSVVRRH